MIGMYILLQYVEGSTDGPIVEWAVAGLGLGPILAASLTVLCTHLNRRVAIRCRAALIQLLYRKALRVDLTAQDSKVKNCLFLLISLAHLDLRSLRRAGGAVHTDLSLCWMSTGGADRQPHVVRHQQHPE